MIHGEVFSRHWVDAEDECQVLLRPALLYSELDLHQFIISRLRPQTWLGKTHTTCLCTHAVTVVPACLKLPADTSVLVLKLHDLHFISISMKKDEMRMRGTRSPSIRICVVHLVCVMRQQQCWKGKSMEDRGRERYFCCSCESTRELWVMEEECRGHGVGGEHISDTLTCKQGFPQDCVPCVGQIPDSFWEKHKNLRTKLKS